MPAFCVLAVAKNVSSFFSPCSDIQEMSESGVFLLFQLNWGVCVCVGSKSHFNESKKDMGHAILVVVTSACGYFCFAACCLHTDEL